MGRPRKDAIHQKIPLSENGSGVNYTTLSGDKYYISQNLDKHKHTLWKFIEGGYQKIASMDSPYDLYKLIEE